MKAQKATALVKGAAATKAAMKATNAIAPVKGAAAMKAAMKVAKAVALVKGAATMKAATKVSKALAPVKGAGAKKARKTVGLANAAAKLKAKAVAPAKGAAKMLAPKASAPVNGWAAIKAAMQASETKAAAPGDASDYSSSDESWDSVEIAREKVAQGKSPFVRTAFQQRRDLKRADRAHAAALARGASFDETVEAGGIAHWDSFSRAPRIVLGLAVS